MTQCILGGLLFLTTLALVMVRPGGISEAGVAGCGALLMVMLGVVRPVEAVQVLLGEWNVFGFFLGLMAFNIGLGPFLRHLLLPALFCIVANVAIFFWRFRSELRGGYDLATLDEALAPPSHRPFFRFVVGGLAIIAASYVLAAARQWPLSFVALGGSELLLAGAAWYRQLNWRTLGREISWSIFVFIGGMLVVVRGVENLGLTQTFGAILLGLAGPSAFGAVASTAIGTALGANLVNNVPMMLIMISAIGAQPAIATPVHTGALYATIFGADLGPNLTTVGSLATMLWLLILRRRGLEVSTMEYLKLGLTVVPIMLLGGAVLIWLQL